jgi:predicted choloylglycine hydrolase
MISGALFDLRGQRSLKTFLILAVLFVAAVVVVNLVAGVFALFFDIAVLAAGIVVRLTCDIVFLPPYVRAKHAPVPFHAAEAEGGRLEIVNGVPVLSLTGTNRRMGRQAGILVKDQLQFLMKNFLHFVFRNPARRATALKKARSLERHIPGQYLEELHGLSETSGVPYEDLLLANTFTEDYRGFLCSTLTVRGSASPGGRLVMGRNLDFISVGVLHHYNMVTVYHPNNGRSFAVVGWPGFIGAVSGMNSLGLTSAMLVSFNGGFSSERIPSTIAFRMLLERCGTVAEATALLEANRTAGPFNLTLADAEGNMCVAELAHNHFATREPLSDILICTNRFHMGEYSETPADYRASRLKSIVRNNRGIFDMEEIKRAMRKVYLPLINLQCMLFLPEERVVHLAVGTMPAAKGEFRRIDLAKWFAGGQGD